MRYPVIGSWRETSPYGERTLNGITGFHDGVDFGGSTDDTIVAIADGIVTYDQDDYDDKLRWMDKHHSAGNMVILRHEIDNKIYYARYLHIIENTVSKGDKVKEGDMIGVYGDVGYSFGAHLHFDLYTRYWEKINPNILFDVIKNG